MMLYIYRLLTWIALIPVCIAVRNHPNFKGTILKRLGFEMPHRPSGELIWLHCASLGEVKAAALLVEALKQIKPEVKICVSSMTLTGRQEAAKTKGIDLVFPFPFDLAGVMGRYFKAFKPKALVIMETEIWPNMLFAAKKAGIPVIFANARMSQRSARNFTMIKPLLKSVLSNATILAIADEDASRFKAIGAIKVEVMGNIKFDQIRSADPLKRESLKMNITENGSPVFIAGSVREGEEKFVVDAVKHAASKIPGLVSIIAPRHLNRVGLVCRLLEASGIEYSLRSAKAKSQVIVVDTMGELFELYGASDCAFVGGSLIDLGGQNILEPVAWGVPVIHGRFMSNFTWALDVVGKWTVKVDNPAALGAAVVDVFDNMPRYQGDAQSALEKLSGLKGISMEYARKI
jgi:3-deoxy-D-manno-octulosonic-acid transferase